MSGVTISDFKIRVRLDSNSAIKGLRRLETMLSTLKKNAAKSLVLNVKLKQQAEQLVQATAKQAKEAANLVEKNKALHESAKKSRVVFGGMVGNIKSANPAMANVVQGAQTLVGGIGRVSKGAGVFLGYLKKAGQMLGKIKSSIFNISNAMTLGFGLYGLFSVVSKIAELVQYIVQNGGKVKQSFATLNASIGNLDMTKGMSPKAINQLKKQQRNFVEYLARTYGVGMAQTAVDYAKFASASANNIGLGTSQDIFKSLTEFGVVYQIGPEKMERVFTAFTQMANKNQVMAEELKTQLGDSLPGALEIFIKALNRTQKYGTVTTQNIWKMMEQGKIVANDVFPYISQVLKEFSSGGLSEALGTVTTQIDILKRTRDEIFTTGTLNQFDDTLGRIIQKVQTLFESRGFQVAVGSWINDWLKELEAGGDDFYKRLQQFEKEFLAAEGDDKKQLELANTFWQKVAMPGAKSFFAYIGNMIYNWIAKALNNFNASDFGKFIEFIGDVFYQALARAFHLLALAILGDDSRIAKVLGDIVNNKNGAGMKELAGAAILDTGEGAWGALKAGYYAMPSPGEWMNILSSAVGSLIPASNTVTINGVMQEKIQSVADTVTKNMLFASPLMMTPSIYATSSSMSGK